MMYPTLYSLLGLTALIPLAVSMPANPAGGGTNVLSLVTPAVNPLPPLPPPPPGWYPIPHTGLSMELAEPVGAAIPPADVARCIIAAQAVIANTIASQGDALLPAAGWQYTNSNVRLSAFRIFPGLGTYSQLSAAIGGLQDVMNKPGEPGSRSVSWITADRGAGVGLVMRGSIELNTGVGTGADGDGGTGAPG